MHKTVQACSCRQSAAKEETRQRDFILHAVTVGLCPVCMMRVPAKVVIKNKKIYLIKTCPDHGQVQSLVEEDASWYMKRYGYDKAGTMSEAQTQIRKGCPYDCGLCPDHDQHTCLALLEVTDSCDLVCPVCFARSRSQGAFLDMHTIGRMMDLFIDSEYGKAEVLQISGGEPTLHPRILDIIAMAQKKKIKYVMLNTNGMRIARDQAFVKAISGFVGGFEVYLQFDGFDEKTHLHFRGKDLRDVKRQAMENLRKYKVPTTLVCTVEKGVNDHELGQIIRFGMQTPYIRGINFQPVAFFGRGAHGDALDRMTMTGVVNRIEKQTKGMIGKDDFIPLPCNVEKVAVTYMYREKDSFIPITRNTRVKDYLHYIKNTFAFDAESVLQQAAQGLVKGDICNCLKFLKDFVPMVPLGFNLKTKKERIEYISANTFRITVTSFLDVHSFDMKSAQKECVHVLTPDLKKMPFSTYNMIHRADDEPVQ